MSLEKFRDKTVLVTGSCGTVGSELVNQLVEFTTAKVICLDNNETELFFQVEKYHDSGRVTGYLADIRNRDTLRMRMRGADIVLHAAALKHVGLCEDSPTEAVRTNIDGTQNVIDAAIDCGVRRVIFTSSDKAVNPTNVMGTSKLMGERLITAASRRHRGDGTVLASVRFGNVLGSRGSVVPLFRRQLAAGGPITLTDPQMSRFIMSLQEAAQLVLEAVWLACGGEVLVTKMSVAMIEDLALVMKEATPGGDRIAIREIGAKPGEKMYEELMNDEEVRRTWEYDRFLVIVPAFVTDRANFYSHLIKCQQPHQAYNSKHERALSREEIKSYMHSQKLI